MFVFPIFCLFAFLWGGRAALHVGCWFPGSLGIPVEMPLFFLERKKYLMFFYSLSISLVLFVARAQVCMGKCVLPGSFSSC